jgi:hypothetical protein
VPAAIDEERGRPRNPAQVCAANVLGDPRRVDLPFELVGKPVDIQTELSCIPGEIRGLEAPLVRKQQLVHLPERPLRTGRFGGFGRKLCVLVHVHEGKMPIDEAQLV